MNRFWVLVFFLGWTLTSQGNTLSRQLESPKQTVRAACPRLKWVEPGILSLSFTYPSQLDDLTGDDMLYILPVLTRPDGKHIAFSPVAYLNCSTKRFLERRLHYQPDPAWQNARFCIADQSHSSGAFLYQDTLAVGEGRGALLDIRYYYANCCHEYYLTSDTLYVPEVDCDSRQLLPIPVLVNRIPLKPSSVVFSVPTVEAIKMREQVVTVPLHYRVNRTYVEEEYMDNALHLAKLDSLSWPIFNEPADYKIRSIRITGYASPEGDFHYNSYLSIMRARGFADYLSEHYKVSTSTMEVKEGGEDWEGLRRLLKSDSLFAQAGEALEVIDRYDDVEEREQRLKMMLGDLAYHYMLQYYYPQLRRMEVELNYSVRAFTPNEALQKISTRPQDLDAYELYEAATRLSPDSLLNTATGRQKYGHAFDLAAKLHPDDMSTRLNAASAALLRYDLQQAYRYLCTLMDDPEAWNNIGVYYWMCGDLTHARDFLVRALPYSPEAAENLKALDAWRRR